MRNDYSIVKVLSGHAKPISGLLPHPTFGLLVSASMDCTIRVWSLLTLKEEYVLETQSPVSGKYFSLYIYISTANLGTPLRFRHHFGASTGCSYAHKEPAYNNHPVSPLTTVIGNMVVIWHHHELTSLFSVVRSAPSAIVPFSNCIYVRCHDKSARLGKKMENHKHAPS